MQLMNNNYLLAEYDNNLRKIYSSGWELPDDRTGVGCRSIIGLHCEIDISKRVPILTKRKVRWDSIVREVLWYISGSHSINDLESMGAKIWTPWKNDEFTDGAGLPRGSGGYIYGFNLIHFGADIQEIEAWKHDEVEKRSHDFRFKTDDGSFDKNVYTKQGVTIPSDIAGFNQLDYVINTLKANPASRQACFTFWRPDTNKKAILPACHAFYSFVASPDEQGNLTVLNCHMFQRSADYPIGVGMGNLWTATLFTYMIAQQVGMTPGKLVHSASHCHIYNNALDGVKEYLSREDQPPSPILTLAPKTSIYDYTIDDFVVSEYDPLPPIKFNIAV